MVLVNAIEIFVVFCFHKLFPHLTSIVNQFLREKQIGQKRKCRDKLDASCRHEYGKIQAYKPWKQVCIFLSAYLENKFYKTH